MNDIEPARVDFADPPPQLAARHPPNQKPTFYYLFIPGSQANWRNRERGALDALRPVAAYTKTPWPRGDAAGGSSGVLWSRCSSALHLAVRCCASAAGERRELHFCDAATDTDTATRCRAMQEPPHWIAGKLESLGRAARQSARLVVECATRLTRWSEFQPQP